MHVFFSSTDTLSLKRVVQERSQPSGTRRVFSKSTKFLQLTRQLSSTPRVETKTHRQPVCILEIRVPPGKTSGACFYFFFFFLLKFSDCRKVTGVCFSKVSIHLDKGLTKQKAETESSLRRVYVCVCSWVIGFHFHATAWQMKQMSNSVTPFSTQEVPDAQHPSVAHIDQRDVSETTV